MATGFPVLYLLLYFKHSQEMGYLFDSGFTWWVWSLVGKLYESFLHVNRWLIFKYILFIHFSFMCMSGFACRYIHALHVFNDRNSQKMVSDWIKLSWRGGYEQPGMGAENPIRLYSKSSTCSCMLRHLSSRASVIFSNDLIY